MSSRARVLGAVLVWVAMVAAWFLYQRSTGLGSTAIAQRFVDDADGNWWAIIAFAAVAAVRPIVLFPAVLLTVAAGVLFGPIIGVAVAVVTANAAALIAYSIGRALRRPPPEAETAIIAGWTHRLRTNAFEAVLMMRLLFLPYDLVSYACGLLHVPRGRFLAANAIGTLPGTVAFVLIGASITRVDEGLGGVEPVTFAVSVALVVLSIVASRILKHRGSSGDTPGGIGTLPCEQEEQPWSFQRKSSPT